MDLRNIRFEIEIETVKRTGEHVGRFFAGQPAVLPACLFMPLRHRPLSAARGNSRTHARTALSTSGRREGGRNMPVSSMLDQQISLKPPCTSLRTGVCWSNQPRSRRDELGARELTDYFTRMGHEGA